MSVPTSVSDPSDELSTDDKRRLVSITTALYDGPPQKRVKYALLLAAAVLEIGDGEDSPAASRLRLLASEV